MLISFYLKAAEKLSGGRGKKKRDFFWVLQKRGDSLLRAKIVTRRERRVSPQNRKKRRSAKKGLCVVPKERS